MKKKLIQYFGDAMESFVNFWCPFVYVFIKSAFVTFGAFLGFLSSLDMLIKSEYFTDVVKTFCSLIK